jgi:1,2-diacylglycerol 3-beta-glucosyltransferase
MILRVLLLLGWPAYNLILALYVAAVAWPRMRRTTRPTGTASMYFWIVVPCLNEERVVGNTVRNALALSAPGIVCRVLVIDDGSDDGTPEVLAGIEDSRLHILRRELPNARKGKGAGLNAAYQMIRDWTHDRGMDPDQVVVGVIDGDGRGSANILAEVAVALADPRIGAVQCRVRIHNRDKLLGAIQDLEFACVADASQILRGGLGSVGLGGNGQFTRLSALEQLGDRPWSHCLVEDMELGLRMHLAGVGIGYVWRACVTQQGVTDARRLLRQRTRWAQGNLQCARYLPSLFRSPQITNRALLEMAYYLLAPWMNALGSVVVVGFWLYAAGQSVVRGWGSVTPVAASGAGLALWLGALLVPGVIWAVLHRVRLRDERLGRMVLAGLAYPGFLLLGLVSTWRAVGRQASGRNGWAKTERVAEEPELSQNLVAAATN